MLRMWQLHAISNVPQLGAFDEDFFISENLTLHITIVVITTLGCIDGVLEWSSPQYSYST